MDNIRLEILEGSHLEHFKQAKEFAMFLPLDNPRRKNIEKELNKIIEEINKIKNKNKNEK